MKRKFILALAIFMLLASLLIVFYPMLSNKYMEHTQAKVFASYTEAVENAASADILEAFEKAEEYNKAFWPGITKYSAEELSEFAREYDNLLNIDNNGVMGYIEIPKLDVSLPIYHGTKSSTLELGCGHLLGSSLPVGGDSTHSILTAHSGLASQKMFSDIDILESKDIIQLQILDKTLTYEVYEKKVVLPEETESIQIIENEDLVSLVTCTPFGVNTHRLVVTAKRTENTQTIIGPSEIVKVETKEASIWEQEYIKGIALGLICICVFCSAVILPIRHLPKYHRRVFFSNQGESL